MLNVGIDFGSTYTMVSVYRQHLGQPEVVGLTEGGNKNIPTVLSCRPDGSRVRIGESAKAGMAGNNRKFRAFKMMLPEDDPERLAARGYDSTFTPEEITRKFLNEVMDKVLDREDDKVIGSLVIGAPEVWYDAFATMDGRTKLRDICRELPYFGTTAPKDAVQVVSEPTAASAYFAYKYLQLKNQPFSGHFLLIDYGGGTLDISLTEVSQGKKREDGNTLEIRVLDHFGVGENEQRGEVGNAGIIYMESLTKEVIKSAYPEMENIPLDNDFFESVDAVEKGLMNNVDEIEEILDEFGTDPEGLTEDRMDGEDVFMKIPYGDGKKIDLTYRMMVDVYNRVIRPVFQEKMEEAQQTMDRLGIDWRNKTSDRFKLVLVGGFGNFYLVKAHMKEAFDIRHNDKRDQDIGLNENTRELAVSLGCSILSAGVIRIRNTAPIGIGVMTLMTKNGKQQCTLSYGLRYHNDIEYDKEYLQTKGKGNALDYVLISSLEYFLVDMGKGPMPLVPKQKFLDILRDAAENRALVYFGFSMDASGVITLYIHDYDHVEEREVSCTSYELTSYKSLFDTQSVDPRVLKLIKESVNAKR